MRTSKTFKRILSSAIALIMLLCMVPAQIVVAEEVAGSSADIVEVHVTATDRETGEIVSVPGAEVNLYVGSAYIRSTKADSNGVAKVSLAGLSLKERKNATISANTVVAQGTAIDGDDRDPLFQYFPKDADGNYYRYTMELHSEKIDEDGNWIGASIPESHESNKVDMVFVIDATGSMTNEINNVKENVASFSENLAASGLDIRFCVIDYRDITCYEPTNVHTASGSHWLTSVEAVENALTSIKASGGGDNPESLLDPLGYVADNSLMSWRSDAYRFAFVLTDASYKDANNYGYTDMNQVIEKLKEMEVVTSVITSSSLRDKYAPLYDTTGGIYANINSRSFDEEMLSLSSSIVESVTRKMTLHLSEPRMLVNMSVCYFANDRTSMSENYRLGVQNMLNEYAHIVAKTTDGHVLIDNVLLFSTNNRLNFYDTSNIASMADIRIETEEKDDGVLWKNVQIHSNAYITGFYSDDTYSAVYNDTGDHEHFTNLKDGNELDGRESFYRIQMSGTEGAGWNNSMLDDAYQHATTVGHETGHYLFGFFDEYLNAADADWRDVGGKPYPAYGLMDNQHDDIEMSKDTVDYSYITGGFTSAADALHTAQSKKNHMSCESFLAELMTSEDFADYYQIICSEACDYDLGPYVATYTKAVGKDRVAGYSYAGLDSDDFLTPGTGAGTGGGGGGGGSWGGRSTASAEAVADAVATQTSVADVRFTSGEETVTLQLTAAEGCTYSVGLLKAGDEDFRVLAMTEDTMELPIAKGDLAEIRIYAANAEAVQYNTYFVDRTEDTDAGYIYGSADSKVMAYVMTDTLSSYTFVGGNVGFVNGEYRSVNQATWITSDNGAGFTSGEIYSVASYMAEIDYTTLTWFKYADGVWTALATDISEEENMNLGGRADLAGEGLYVLMAKPAPAATAKPAENLAYTQSTDRDAVITLTFDDPNTTSKYYNVYYSESEFTGKDAENVIVRSFHADSTELVLDLLERGRTVYAAVEIVLEDGTRSELSDIILIGGEADSDGDGIPDWYCNKYLLWGLDGEDKDIAGSDDDGDGLTNLEEYLGGSDPTDPNDPVHTTNVPVASISTSVSEAVLYTGETLTVHAIILPENATNKNVNWEVVDSGIATIEIVDGTCLITAVNAGKTQIYSVSADGGFSAVIQVEVVINEHDLVKVEEKPATHDEDGNIAHYICQDCNKLFADFYAREELTAEDIVIVKLGHTYDAYQYDDEEHWQSCTCGQIANKAAHEYGQWEIVKDADSNSEGLKERVCTTCGYKHAEAIPPVETNPDTGDSTQIVLWMTLMIMSACGAVLAVAMNLCKEKKHCT